MNKAKSKVTTTSQKSTPANSKAGGSSKIADVAKLKNRVSITSRAKEGGLENATSRSSQALKANESNMSPSRSAASLRKQELSEEQKSNHSSSSRPIPKIGGAKSTEVLQRNKATTSSVVSNKESLASSKRGSIIDKEASTAKAGMIKGPGQTKNNQPSLAQSQLKTPSSLLQENPIRIDLPKGKEGESAPVSSRFGLQEPETIGNFGQPNSRFTNQKEADSLKPSIPEISLVLGEKGNKPKTLEEVPRPNEFDENSFRNFREVSPNSSFGKRERETKDLKINISEEISENPKRTSKSPAINGKNELRVQTESNQSASGSAKNSQVNSALRRVSAIARVTPKKRKDPFEDQEFSIHSSRKAQEENVENFSESMSRGKGISSLNEESLENHRKNGHSSPNGNSEHHFTSEIPPAEKEIRRAIERHKEELEEILKRRREEEERLKDAQRKRELEESSIGTLKAEAHKAREEQLNFETQREELKGDFNCQTLKRFNVQLHLLELEKSRLHSSLISKDRSIEQLSDDLKKANTALSEIPNLKLQMLLMAIELTRLSEAHESLTQGRSDLAVLKGDLTMALDESRELKKEIEKLTCESLLEQSELREKNQRERVEFGAKFQSKTNAMKSQHENEISRIRRDHFEQIEQIQREMKESFDSLESFWQEKLRAKEKEWQISMAVLRNVNEQEKNSFKRQVEILEDEIREANQREVNSFKGESNQRTKRELGYGGSIGEAFMLEKANEKIASLEEQLRLLREKEERVSSAVALERESFASKITKYELEIQRLSGFEKRTKELDEKLKLMSQTTKEKEEEVRELIIMREKDMLSRKERMEESQNLSESMGRRRMELEKEKETLKEQLEHERKMKAHHEEQSRNFQKDLMKTEEELVHLRKEHRISMMGGSRTKEVSLKHEEVFNAKENCLPFGSGAKRDEEFMRTVPKSLGFSNEFQEMKAAWAYEREHLFD